MVESSSFRPGEVIAGKYRVEAVLGEGGMGVVLAAHHLHLDQRVALKFLRDEIAQQPEAITRFMREARAVVRIKSDHVARVLDVGALDTGLPYIVMEYLDGTNLSAELSRRGAFSVEEAVEFVLQASEALAEAHVLGIVHRDLKPANLFLTRRPDGAPWIKVLDFGISKIIGRLNEFTATQTAAVMGSPLYMSPEQIRATRDVDARTDIWSLGVILYELISGRAPFQGQTLPDVSVKIAVEPPAPLAQKHVPSALEAIIQRCLEKDRERRFRNVGELARELGRFGSKRARASAEHVIAIAQAAQGGASLQPVAVSAPPVAAPGGETRTFASWGRTSPPSKHRRMRLALALTAGVVSLAGVVAAVFMLRKPATLADDASAHALASEASSAAPQVVEPARPIASETAPVVVAPAPSAAPPPKESPTAANSTPPAATAARPANTRPARPTAPTNKSAAEAPSNVFDQRVFPKARAH